MGLAVKEEIKRRRKMGTTTTSRPRASSSVIDPITLLLTPERAEKAGDEFIIGGDDRTGKVLRLTDEPLERLWRQSKIAGKEYSALQKYRHHWYHTGMASGAGSPDLNRVFAADPYKCFLAGGEAKAHHYSQYKAAVQELGQVVSVTVERVVCHEWPLEQAGHKLGYNSPFRARLKAASVLRDAGSVLARFWGIG